jgi:hypothetical protein
MKNIIMMSTALSLLVSTNVMADANDFRIDDRIENRLDNKGNLIKKRLDNNLDNNSDRVENRLNNREDRVIFNSNVGSTPQLDYNGNRIDQGFQRYERPDERAIEQQENKTDRISDRLDSRVSKPNTRRK